MLSCMFLYFSLCYRYGLCDSVMSVILQYYPDYLCSTAIGANDGTPRKNLPDGWNKEDDLYKSRDESAFVIIPPPNNMVGSWPAGSNISDFKVKRPFTVTKMVGDMVEKGLHFKPARLQEDFSKLLKSLQTAGGSGRNGGHDTDDEEEDGEEDGGYLDPSSVRYSKELTANFLKNAAKSTHVADLQKALLIASTVIKKSSMKRSDMESLIKSDNELKDIITTPKKKQRKD